MMRMPAILKGHIPPAQLTAWTLLALLATDYAMEVVWKTRYHGWGDFRAYYTAARALEENRNPYDIHVVDNIWRGLGYTDLKPYASLYVYPPPFLIFILPLTHLPFLAAARLWLLLNAFLWPLCIVFLLRFLHISRMKQASLITILIAFKFDPALLTLQAGQVNILTFFLTILSLDCLRRGHTWGSAAILSGSFLVKPTGVLLLFYFLLRRRWYFLLQVGMCGLLLLFLCLPVTGFQTWTNFFTFALPFLSTGQDGLNNPYNQSLIAFGYRALRLVLSDDLAFVLGRLLGRSLGLAAASAALVCCWRRRLPRGHLASDEIALVLLTGWLLTPTAWDHHLVCAILAFAVTAHTYAQSEPSKLELVAWIGALIFVGVINDYYVHPFFQSGPAVFLSFIKLYGITILYLSLLRSIRRSDSAHLWAFNSAY